MGNPNLVDTLPELPQHGGEAALWARQALAGVVLSAYSNAKWAASRMADLQVVIPAPERRPEQPQPTVAERIINAQPYVAPREVAAPRYGGASSQAIRAHVEAYVPNALSAEDQARSVQEMAALEEVVDAYRARAGMPVKNPETASSAPAPGADTPLTSLEQAESAFPNDGSAHHYDGRTLGEIRDEINGLRDEQPEAGSE